MVLMEPLGRFFNGLEKLLPLYGYPQILPTVTCLNPYFNQRITLEALNFYTLWISELLTYLMNTHISHSLGRCS